MDGTRNITRQPSSQPGVFDGLTSTIRLRHQLDSGWIWNTQYGMQRLRADDRLTYASGCSSSQPDSFCMSPSGDFEIRDYRSENERRNNEVMQTDIRGNYVLSDMEHSFKVSLMRLRQINRMPATFADDLLGTTNTTSGGLIAPTNANSRAGALTNSADHSTELAINDRMRLTPQTTAWLGLRLTQLNRQSIQTDGNAAVNDTRNVNTPWVALSQQLNPHDTLYASYGYGLEVEAAPNLTNYSNAGQPLPAMRSTQREIGWKRQYANTFWQATWFDIARPITTNGLNCSNAANSCTRQIDGQAHHKGLELSTQTKLSQWNLSSSAMWLDAKNENATIDPRMNGQRPTNVPEYILRGMAQYSFSNVPGLRAGLRASHEGMRRVTNTDNGNITLPAWTTFDATTHYDTKVNQSASTWTLAIHNLTNKHYWRESPYQYGQYFLYPGAPRTVRATVVFHL